MRSLIALGAVALLVAAVSATESEIQDCSKGASDEDKAQTGPFSTKCSFYK